MPLHDPTHRTFASDNYAGLLPEAIAAIADANGGHQIAYGEDVYTAELGEVIRDEFGDTAEVFPVFNGTGANVVALTAMVPRWGAVITSANAHIHTDEGGAPERVSGLKLLPVSNLHGRITPESIATEAWGWGDEHRAQPLVVSITQTTELGTVYTPDEISAVTEYAHEHGMAVHLDGARIWNAAAALDLPLSAFTSDVGVDVLSLGGTKNGLLGAEAVVVLDPERAEGVTYLRKLSMQLASKMRFQSAQLLALFTDRVGVRAAAHANAMASRLHDAVADVPGLTFAHPVEANALFPVIDLDAADRIRETFRFYDWDRAASVVRWMCSFDTTEADVDAFATVVRRELAA